MVSLMFTFQVVSMVTSHGQQNAIPHAPANEGVAHPSTPANEGIVTLKN